MNANDLKRYRRRNDLRMDALLNIANAFIERIAPNQPSDRVSNLLTERNVRYYINQGLVDRPIGKDGVSALYGYRHLLQLIALKKLQSRFIPVKNIAVLLEGKTDSQLLEMAVGQPVERRQAPDNAALAFLNNISAPHPIEKDVDQNSPLSSKRASKTEFRKKYRSSTGTPKSSKPRSMSWKRYELDEGIEIHIRDDLNKQTLRSTLKKAMEAFLKTLLS